MAGGLSFDGYLAKAGKLKDKRPKKLPKMDLNFDLIFILTFIKIGGLYV